MAWLATAVNDFSINRALWRALTKSNTSLERL
jgi:hypothetical protein